MKKLVSIVALLAVLLLASSAFNVSDSLAVGDKAPEFAVENAHGIFDLNKCESKYVLLTFWSSSDAKSRIDCNAYSHWSATHPGSGVKHVALNFDSQTPLFEEVVRLDKLDDKAQFNVKGSEARSLMIAYGLLEGFGSILIGSDGRIMSFNPTKHDLSSLN